MPRRGDLSTGIYNRGHNNTPASEIKHDPLHMQPGLDNCWCMCPACFDRVLSKCICLSCPCSSGR